MTIPLKTMISSPLLFQSVDKAPAEHINHIHQQGANKIMELKDILEARQRLTGVVHTYLPLEKSGYFSQITEGNVYLKCENRQKTGSFKVRGTTNKIGKLLEEKQLSHVIAASAGNHAQGVAFSAFQHGIKATIVMPRGASIAKISATRGYGAEVVLYGEVFDEAYAYAKELQKELNAEFIEPFNDFDIIAGQGTIGVEIMEEMKDADIVVVPTGGGGLLAGVALAVKSINPKVRVIGVQAEKANALVRSYNEKSLTSLSKVFTIADGIAVGKPGEKPFGIIKENVDEMITVSDDEIASTIIDLIERTKQIVEPAGAAALTAVAKGKIDVKGKNVVCVLSGGNIDVGFIHKIIEKGLTKRGRLLPLAVLHSDIPGSLERVFHIIASHHANVCNVTYDRSSPELRLNEVIVRMVCEVSGREQGEQILADIVEDGFKLVK